MAFLEQKKKGPPPPPPYFLAKKAQKTIFKRAHSEKGMLAFSASGYYFAGAGVFFKSFLKSFGQWPHFWNICLQEGGVAGCWSPTNFPHAMMQKGSSAKKKKKVRSSKGWALDTPRDCAREGGSNT